MRVKRQNVKDYLFILFHLGLMAAILAFVYQQFIHLNNLNWGTQSLNYSALSLLLLLAALLVIAFNFVGLDYKPSRIFLAIYSFIVVLPFAALNSVSGVISDGELIISFLLIMLPMVFVAVAARMPFFHLPKLRNRVKESWFGVAFFSLACIGILVFLSNPTPSAGFDYGDSYTRRFEARDLYVSGSLAAYLLITMINSVLPYLSFKGANKGNQLWLGLAILGCFFFFWLSGNKSQFLWVSVAAAFGLVMRWQLYRARLHHVIFIAIWSLVVILACEWVIFDHYSLISDVFLRRVFILNAQIQGFYYDAIINARVTDWSVWLGRPESAWGPFYIGETYFNRPEVSANTSGFLDVLLEGGLLGFFLTVTLAAGFLRLLDTLYMRSKKADYCFLALIFSFLITEQKFSIVLGSSGILFLLTFISCMPNRKSSVVVTS